MAKQAPAPQPQNIYLATIDFHKLMPVSLNGFMMIKQAFAYVQADNEHEVEEKLNNRFVIEPQDKITCTLAIENDSTKYLSIIQ